MIQPSSLFELVDTWSLDEIATENDALLAAFVALRLDACGLYTSLSGSQMPEDKAALRRTSSLLMLASERIRRWNDRWSQRCRERGLTRSARQCDIFLLEFYGLHARLQLYALPLQGVVASGDADSSPGLEMMWSAYSNAIEMLHLLQRNSGHLYYAQDSIHVMTAYGASFLCKVSL
jgi:hypothetical protein